MRNHREMLICLSCAMLLPLLLAAAVRRLSAEAAQILCAGHLRGIYTMVGSYCADYGVMPPARVKASPRWRYWYDHLLPYSDDPKIFYCPADPRAAEFFTGITDPLLVSSFSAKFSGYGMNLNFSAAKPSSLRENPATVLMGDSQGPLLRPTKACWKDDYAPRHTDKANFIMGNGEIRLMDKNILGLTQSFDGWKSIPSMWRLDNKQQQHKGI